MDFSLVMGSMKLWLDLMGMLGKGMYQTYMLLPLSKLK